MVLSTYDCSSHSRGPDQASSTKHTDEDLKEKYWGPPFDARFPNQNQTRNCWQNYVDYFRCLKIKGEEFTPCEYFKKVYTHLCPEFWVEQWDEQREKGCFPGKI